MSFEIFGHNFYFLSDERQIYKAINMLRQYILKPEVLILVLLLAAYFILRCSAKIFKREKLSLMLKKISPWIYFVAILSITVFNRESTSKEIRILHDSWFTAKGFHESAVLDFMFNILLYIPFGYMLYKWVLHGRAWLSAVIVIAASFTVEGLQYILARGVAATDDLTANVFGGITGIFISVLIHKIKFKKRESVE